MLYCALALALLSANIEAISFSDWIKTSLAATAVYAGYRWCQTPVVIPPTAENIFLCTLTPLASTNSETSKTIRDYLVCFQQKKTKDSTILTVTNQDKTVIGYSTICPGVSTELDNPPFIFLLCRGHVASRNRSRGRPGIGGGALFAYMLIRDKIAHCPIVAFDYQDSRWSLDFGQETEIAYTAYAYQQVQQQYPNAKIILIGDSLGALRIMNFVAKNQPKNLGGIILLAPFLTLPLCIDQMYQYYFPTWAPGWGKSLIELLVYTYFCNYSAHKQTIFDAAQQIKDTPIFIGQRLIDNVTPHESLLYLIELLKENNPTYYYFTPDTGYNHSHVNRVPDMQDALNYFYKINNLPYDEEAALRGMSLLILQ